MRGVLDLDYYLSPYMLVMAHCHFSDDISMSHSGFRLLGLTGSRLEKGLMGSGLQIDSDLMMVGGFSADEAVHLLDANIGGNLLCNGGEFKQGARAAALIADRIKVGGNVSLGDNFSAKGCARFLGANIGGYLACDNGKFFQNKAGWALAADGIKVENGLFMGNGFWAEGLVRFPNAHINGGVDCDGGEFDGMVSFEGAEIGGDLSFENSVFKNNEELNLSADMIKVGGNVYLNGNFRAAGVVNFLAADVGGSLFCSGGTFEQGFAAGGAKIKGRVIWRKTKGAGVVNFADAYVGVLSDDECRKAFDFILRGFVCSRFHDTADVKSRIAWLKRRPAKVPFSPQPFEQAAKVLFAMGHNNDAREVLLEKERLLTKHGKLPLWHKYFWRPLWHALAGYGYRLLWTLVWSVMFIAVGRALFDFADYSCRIAPHQPVAVLNNKYEPMSPGEECTDARRPTNVMAREYPDYPRFDALAFSLDVFIPVFALHQESHWYPQQQKGDTNVFLRWLRLWYWIQIGAGWILTSLLVLTITGLLRPRQSGGE